MTDATASCNDIDLHAALPTINTKRPRQRMFVIVGLLLLCVIPLAVGLGVGLGKHKHANQAVDQVTNTIGRPSLWTPQVGVSWQIVLSESVKADTASNTISPDVDVYVVDLFDTNVETIQRLSAMGKNVICYFSAGSWESWRTDADDYNPADLGNNLEGWEGERWVQLSGDSVRAVMRSRIELAAEKGCHGIDPDNVDGYENYNGLGLSTEDSINFVEFLADEARKYNMATGLKNAGEIIPSVIGSVHFAVNEECVEYSECKTFTPFIEAGKPVFHIEYPEGAPNVSSSDQSRICSTSGAAAGRDNFSTVIKKMNLDGWVQYCDGQSSTTPTE